MSSGSSPARGLLPKPRTSPSQIAEGRREWLVVNLSYPDVALGLNSDWIPGLDLEVYALGPVLLDFVVVAESVTAPAVEHLYGQLLHCCWTAFLAA